MAHIKASGATRQGINVAGKRLGVKKFGGEAVKSGNIIIRQRGTKFHPGEGVQMGRDHTLFAVRTGKVFFRKMSGKKRGQFFVDVVVAGKADAKPAEAKVATKPAKSDKKTETPKKTAKKVEKPKSTK